jgi:hypothetical protein
MPVSKALMVQGPPDVLTLVEAEDVTAPRKDQPVNPDSKPVLTGGAAEAALAMRVRPAATKEFVQKCDVMEVPCNVSIGRGSILDAGSVSALVDVPSRNHAIRVYISNQRFAREVPLRRRKT